MSNLFMTVVIPAFNEELRIGYSLKKVVRYLASRDIEFEVIVVDDGSEDRTLETAQEFAGSHRDQRIRVLRNSRNRGKGFSVREGMLRARSRYALLTDADLSTPIEEMAKLEVPVVKGSCALAFGSRDVQGSQIEIHQPWLREAGGKIFNRIVQLATGLRFRDTQCGFKLFDMERCGKLFELQTIDDFGFDVELIYLARKLKLEMAEVPVSWSHQSGSKVQLLRDALLMLADLVRIRWNDMRGFYRLNSGSRGS